MAETRGGAPSTLLARTNLILGISALLIVAIATFALYTFVVDPVSEQSADDEAALLVLSAQTWVELPPEARPYFELEMAENHDIIISELRQELPTSEPESRYLQMLRQNLSARLDSEIVWQQGNDLIWVDVPMGGHVLQLGFAPDRQEIQPLYSAIVIFGLVAAIVFFTSLFIVQRIARPLVRVAQQAENFRGAAQMEPLPESGPRELASLARNFNTMANEISNLLANRTTLLAGISHDLRTPLTRMRLALALLPDSVDPTLVARFERNLEAMDELIADALHFARGTGEPAQLVEIVPLIEDVLHRFDGEVHVQMLCDPHHRVLLAAVAFQRVLMNLVSNGLQHGTNVRVRVDESQVSVTDDGPGIPEAFREQVFQPFFRLDESRNQATGGSGLGLAIVSQLCQTHGWRVAIEDGDAGGTRVVLTYAQADAM